MLKNTGVLRKVDELGRIVLPISLRKKLNISQGDSLEIYIENNNVLKLKKYERSCIFCENTKNLTKYQDNLICKTCLNKIKTLNYVD